MRPGLLDLGIAPLPVASACATLPKSLKLGIVGDHQRRGRVMLVNRDGGMLLS